MPRGPKDKTGVSFSPRVPEANPRRLCLVAFNPLMKLLRTLGVGTGFARYTLRSGAGALGRWIHRRCVGGGIVPARVVIVAHDQPPLGADHTKNRPMVRDWTARNFRAGWMPAHPWRASLDRPKLPSAVVRDPQFLLGG